MFKSESEVTQSLPTLCDSMDYSPPGSSVHGILQARILSGWPFPSPGDLNPGIEPMSPALRADNLWSEPPGNLAKKFTQVFLYHLTAELEWTFWPT